MSNLAFPLAALGASIKKRDPYDSISNKESASGKEFRSTWWSYQRTKYVLSFQGARSDAQSRLDYQQLVSFWKRHRGSFDSWLLVDPEDSAVSGHGFGVGDGATTSFQLQRRTIGTVYDNLGGPWLETSLPRTNLVTFSEQIDNAAWTKTAATVTANATGGPDGNATADKLVESATGAAHLVKSAAFVTVAGQTYTYSVFAKAAERTVVGLANATVQANFDLSAGVVIPGSVAGCTAAIYAAGGGWYRCSITLTVAGASDQIWSYINGVISYAGDGASGVYVWGAQAEKAASPSRYIQTASLAATVNPAFWPLITDGFEPVTDFFGPVSVSVNGTVKTLGTDYTLPGSGVVTFGAAPASNALFTWSGSYFIRCRFADESLPLDWIVRNMWNAATINLVSVK